MKLKKKLSTLDGLEDNVKQLYTEKDGEYFLNLDEGNDDSDSKELDSVLKHNKELLDEIKKLKRSRKEDEDRKAQEEEEAARKKGDYESLLKSVEQKLAEKDKELQTWRAKNNDYLIQKAVTEVAAQLCDGSNVNLMKPHLMQRFKVDDNGELKVVDRSGGETVFSQEDLIKEFQSNKDFAPILRGTKSSGGGATGGSSGGASSQEIDKMSPLEKLKFAHEQNANKQNS